MSLGRGESEDQVEFWTPTEKLARGPGSPFYAKLNGILREERFAPYVEERCAEYYAEYYAEKMGRPGVPPGVYFRMLLVGYFERIPSDRGIAWRCADSLSLRGFLGYGLDEETPDHSSLSRIRQRLPLEVHEEVFGWVLSVLARRGLIDGARRWVWTRRRWRPTQRFGAWCGGTPVRGTRIIFASWCRKAALKIRRRQT